MERLIIVGAGGLGREVDELAWDDYANGRDWMMGGFLDTRPNALEGYQTRTSVIGDPHTFIPQPQDIFIVAVGDVALKKKLVAPLVLRGARFVSLRTNVRMGARCTYGASVFGDRATLSVDVTVGNYAYIGADVIVGHDSVIGDYAHVGPRCFVAGRVKVGPLATIHPMATLAMDAEIGEGATVGAGAVVFGKVAPHTTVLGNPARKFEFK
jgi:sugar O-acyltransferase (sialic acid O-acetyltransferase NeuD family)